MNVIRGWKFRDDDEVAEEVNMWLWQTPQDLPTRNKGPCF
jgi:hypothetical protein